MRPKTISKQNSIKIHILTLILLVLYMTGCGASAPSLDPSDKIIVQETSPEHTETSVPESTPNDSASNLANIPTPTPVSSDTQGTRDNTAFCLVPSADGIVTDGNELVTLDLSHIDCGYFMTKYLGSNDKVKMQVTGPNDITYTYNLKTSFEAFPFAAGNGEYMIAVHENISGTQYATIFSTNVTVSITDEFSPYLYPNQYVDFNNNSDIVSLASELAYSANDDLTVVTNIYNYIISNITYDFDKAANVQSGYIPVVDEILITKKGICFDFASAMASMLRSQRIPTRLEIGYAGETYHAWISTYLDEKGWVNGIIEFDGQSWKLMDPTFAAGSSEKDLKDFIGDGTNYVTKYIY